MWLLFSGINTADTYRIEVVTTVEFIPTMGFDPWSPAMQSKIMTKDTESLLHDVSLEGIFDVITGELGRDLFGGGNTGMIVNKAIETFQSFM